MADPPVSAVSGNAGAPRGRRAVVLYDGRCALCLRSLAILRRLDWLHRLRFADARDLPQVPQREPPLKPDRLLEEMHLITPDGSRVYTGFRAFRWIAGRLPPLWPLAPLLFLPGAATLGQRLYLWVARNRFHLVACHGSCPLPDRPVP